MSDLQSLKEQVGKLSPQEQIELAVHIYSSNKKSKKLVETLSWFPTPITDSDKLFIKENKNNKNIQRDKIKFTEKTIECNGLKFPRNIVKYDDIKNTSWLKLNENVYQKDGHDYFTFDAVQKLGGAWHKIPTKDQRQQAADVFGWDYWLLGQLLNYPKAGVRRSNGTRDDVGSESRLRSSTPHLYGAYAISFPADGSGYHSCYVLDHARSLVFLQG